MLAYSRLDHSSLEIDPIASLFILRAGKRQHPEAWIISHGAGKSSERHMRIH
jgi:hypothetical protein